jgi:hypothetical protein
MNRSVASMTEQAQLSLNGREHRVGVQAHVGDHVREKSPFGFGNAEEEMFAVQRGMAGAPCCVD